MTKSSIFLFLILILSFLLIRAIQRKKNNSKFHDYLERGAVIVDVRSKLEFQKANNPNSQNIPLTELAGRAEELDKDQIIILCCASGTRSGMAMPILKKKGFLHIFNAGSWKNTCM